MGGPTIRCEVPFELNAGLAAGRRSLAEHRQQRLLLFRAVFRAVFYLQVELDFWRAHTVERLAASRINESPSSNVRMGVWRRARALRLSSETSRGRAARPGAMA